LPVGSAAGVGFAGRVAARVGFVVGSRLGGWEDAGVKGSGSMWFGYAVVVLVTFVVGFLGFAVWVLSKVF